jgi:hypothetical protein
MRTLVRTAALLVTLIAGVGCGGPTAAPSYRPSTRAVPASAFTYERGVLIAHWLGGIAPRYEGQSGVPHTYAGAWFDEEDVRWIAAHGFDHLQIAVDAREWAPQNGRLPEGKISPFERILRFANGVGLGVVMVYEPTDDATVERVAREWGLVAARLAPFGEGLRFHAGDADLPANDDLGARFRAYVAAVRGASPRRFFYVPAPLGEPSEGQTNLAGVEARNRAYLRRLELDKLDADVGVSFEYWEPKVFTFQFRSSVNLPFPGTVPDFRAGAVPKGSYGGADEYNQIAAAASGKVLRPEDVVDDLTRVAAAVATEAPGHALYLSRFGVAEGNEPLSTRRYLGAVVGAARALGVGWSIYDYESGRAIRNADGSSNANYDGLGLRPRQMP